MTEIISTFMGLGIVFLLLEVYRYRIRRQTTEEILTRLNKKYEKK
ncbi:hypothetical protein LEP1GSC079_5184 [Leptospira interrogans str. FPW1039]|uniref:Uncharacterized protein n=2 Tax=Leptospira interrogans TaxID=173 RepID=A0A0E2D8V7_LEPIR|nr:hypothetical protein [Leptospira interrogans]EKR56490.1 hypothetical protein LEP1GSC105_4234 [Leptospira interrogans str. UI 12758]EMJ34063.1 hypothetical protein LEP1GSC079_5184 [Leptospira interrogans str. FPW1039]EMN34618.1 hypothetical protein LEP1GSC084_0013 [Leptospira interrogans serovar Medanensis str. L0448]